LQVVNEETGEAETIENAILYSLSTLESSIIIKPAL
jgi:hypothetical protein